MKIAAITMVHQDHWALSEWVRHYGDLIGEENLYVIAHGRDDEVARICGKASMMTVPRDDLTGFDRKRGELMNGLHAGLLQLYDWVIRTDADELLCIDPARWNSLSDVLEGSETPALFALGFDLVETPGDGPIGRLFETRRNAAFTGHYSKAVATREPLGLSLHGVRVPARRLASFGHHIPDGVYLAHLKYANATALAGMNRLRSDIANGTGPGLPGAAWGEADADALKFIEAFEAKRLAPWDVARDEAIAECRKDPVRLPGRNVVRTRSARFGTRTILPTWFAG